MLDSVVGVADAARVRERGVLDRVVRDKLLVNEVRAELKGSIAAWFGLLVVTSVLAFWFAGRAQGFGYSLWLAAMSVLLTAWLVAWSSFTLRPPSEHSILRRWIPGAKLGMRLGNLVAAAGVWVFLPVSDADMRALMLVLYAWFLVIQFAAATEATQVLASAVLMVLGSLTVWLAVNQPPHFVALIVFMALFGATLIAIRRFVREAVVQAIVARAEADASNQALTDALARLERERDAKTHFIRAASHDLQQPLHAATLFLDGIKPGARASTATLDKTRQALGAARNLLNAMLGHLRLEGGAVRPEWTHFAAGEVFDRVLLTQGTAAAAAGVRLSFVGRRVTVFADVQLLARAVENLVSNAIRHSGGRRVVIGARRRGEQVTIWVVDDGCGLAEADEARLFLPFEQGPSVGAAGGFGLGLASTSGLAAVMEGSCGVERNLTRGAAFYLRLLTRSPADELQCVA